MSKIVRLGRWGHVSVSHNPREGCTSSRQALRPHPRRVHQRAFLPHHFSGGVARDGPSLNLVSQEEFQDLVLHGLSGHIDGTAPSAVVQLWVGAVKKEKPGGVVATVEGGEEEGCLSLK